MRGACLESWGEKEEIGNQVEQELIRKDNWGKPQLHKGFKIEILKSLREFHSNRYKSMKKEGEKGLEIEKEQVWRSNILLT